MKQFVTKAWISADDMKRIRKSAGITQRELAAWAGVSVSTVERWEVSSEPIAGQRRSAGILMNSWICRKNCTDSIFLFLLRNRMCIGFWKRRIYIRKRKGTGWKR